jgi:ABC-type ATPase involved in cell division
LVAGHSGGAVRYSKSKLPTHDRRPQRIHVVSRFLRTFNALGAPQQVLFKRRKVGFVFHHAKVVSLQIVISNVVHTNLV